MKKYLSLILVVFFINANSYAYDTQHFNSNKKNYNSKLQIFENNTEIAQFLVAIVADDTLREYGLMNLKRLDAKNGMLFIFNKPDIINMWMKDTFIALDIIFIDKNDIIVTIKENTKPLSLDIVSSEKKVDKALEINAFEARKLGIKIGQKIKYENF